MRPRAVGAEIEVALVIAVVPPASLQLQWVNNATDATGVEIEMAGSDGNFQQIDEVGPTVAKGRSRADAPEIDGAVYLSSRRPLKVGEIVTAKIERADEYDLHGSVAGFGSGVF